MELPRRRKKRRELDYEALAADAIKVRTDFSSRWFTVEAVLPAEMRLLWEEVAFRFRQMGVTHENKQVEAGMMIEYLAAEYLAGPSPLDYLEAHRDVPEDGYLPRILHGHTSRCDERGGKWLCAPECLFYDGWIEKLESERSEV